MAVRGGVVISICIAVEAIVLDLFSKKWAFSPGDHAFFFLNGLIQSVRHENHGLIANIPVPQAMIILGALVLLAGLFIFWRERYQRAVLLQHIAVGYLCGGAVGNLYDRLQFGFVRDWILLFNRSAINVADISIVLGVFLFFLASSVSEDYGKNPPA